MAYHVAVTTLKTDSKLHTVIRHQKARQRASRLDTKNFNDIIINRADALAINTQHVNLGCFTMVTNACFVSLFNTIIMII